MSEVRTRMVSEAPWQTGLVSPLQISSLGQIQSGSRAGQNIPLFDRVVSQFWQQVEQTPNCWLWHGRMARDYGQICFRDHSIQYRVMAHRFAYTILRGPIPNGLTIDHLCRNKVCVNPTHMEIVTLRENSIRATPYTRTLKLVCIRGHSMTGLKLVKGKRRCRPCGEYLRRKYRAKITPSQPPAHPLR